MLDDFYRHIVFQLEQNEDIESIEYPVVDELIFVEGQKLDSVVSFVNANPSVNEEDYVEFLDKYMEVLLSRANIDEDQFEVLVRYMPIVDDILLGYFADLESFYSELSTLVYYVCSFRDCSSHLQIANLLIKGYE